MSSECGVTHMKGKILCTNVQYKQFTLAAGLRGHTAEYKKVRKNCCLPLFLPLLHRVVRKSNLFLQLTEPPGNICSMQMWLCVLAVVEWESVKQGRGCSGGVMTSFCMHLWTQTTKTLPISYRDNVVLRRHNEQGSISSCKHTKNNGAVSATDFWVRFLSGWGWNNVEYWGQATLRLWSS